ncbi:hypothetical protein [Burkholderia pseudomultivorans]|uniref:hypothetical protein n=1 Tax=Burkholderia pseudomultivorans TaxID=1207504 RepID=UPI0012D98367|nr:hypothetical protein [Burkholderia pseudomultivorans]
MTCLLRDAEGAVARIGVRAIELSVGLPLARPDAAARGQGVRVILARWTFRFHANF